jgi:hypothetical protein
VKTRGTFDEMQTTMQRLRDSRPWDYLIETRNPDGTVNIHAAKFPNVVPVVQGIRAPAIVCSPQMRERLAERCVDGGHGFPVAGAVEIHEREPAECWAFAAECSVEVQRQMEAANALR